ncbi:MAG: type II secretion system minor pseudopilin GspK [Proteobacteria bacterium]|nr:type II secretion system minor pseudopilin GspK [Pseudomonadota bacterium]
MIHVLRKSETGVALILTLLITAILVTLIVEVNYSTQVDVRISGNFRNDLQTSYLAKSGVNIAASYLKYDGQNTDTDNLTEDWAKSFPPLPVGEGFVKVMIGDENSKININRAVKETGEVDQVIYDALSRLFEREEVDLGILDALIDWIDPNDEGEAEGNYYRGLDPPYACKNGPLDTLSELLMIKGITDEVYAKISQYLTIYSDGKVNINTASKEVLLCLDDAIDDGIAQEIIQYREEAPFDTKGELKDMLNDDDLYGRIESIIDVKSNAFTVVSIGQVERVEKVVRAVIDREGAQISYRYWRVE